MFFKKRILLFLLLVTLLAAEPLQAAVNINLVAANASSTETKKSPIKYYLPKELAPEDIISIGNLELDYDIDRAEYYLHGSVELAPKETKTIKIEVQDVWHFSSDEVDILKKQIDDNVSLLAKTPYYESAQILRESMFSKLDFILAQQSNYSDNIERRIEEYRSHLGIINDIRRNSFSSEYFKSSASQGEVVKTVKFVIDVGNPAKDKEKKFQQQHYLPVEVHSKDVIEAQGFEIRFDDKKKQSFLSREETFAPGEKKRYEIVIKDVWSISQEKVTNFRERAQRAIVGIKGSEYEGYSKYIFDDVDSNLQKIEELQTQKQDMKKYIGAYRVNKERLVKIEDQIMRLESMLATVTAKKLEESEKSKVKNVLQKLKALRGITELSKAIFGKKPSINTTWRVIWGVMGFIAFFTTFHFFTWWRKSQVLGEEMAIRAGGIAEVKAKKEEEPEKA